jgi:Family of unknown function (DUF6064)
MSEWWTYSLSDFLLFSPRTYYRLFELYNLAIWPAHVVALVLAAAILGLLLARAAWQGRAILAILAGCWLWVAWAYLLERYDTINWTARYFAIAFVLQAVLLLWQAAFGRICIRLRSDMAKGFGLAIFLFAVLLYPTIAPMVGRPWMQAEVFGIAPDPTAIATMGILLVANERARWELLAIPLAWCGISTTTLWTMGSPDALVPVLVGTVAVVTALKESRGSSEEYRSRQPPLP